MFLLAPLARLDPDWIVSNAALVEHDNLAVRTALPVTHRVDLIEALRPWPPEKQSILARAVWKEGPAAEASRLRSLLWKS